jgi:putative ABC transport system ATP-binding protein/macrolide transport system ATP-binding/permease protein/lipoprotein-releasing system ATP-binding protein
VGLSAQALTKRYGEAPGYEAVRGASLDLAEGELVAIVGRSGSGKSTLLAMLGALTPPSGGRAVLDGADIWALPERERAALRCRRIGFVFQFPSLLPNLTAADNVALPALLGRTMNVETAQARACELLSRVGLAGRGAAYPASLSGGEQRRVAIARALVNRPRLLLADEPTSDLDEDTEADTIALLEALHQSDGFAFVLVTHNLEIAARAPRVLEMRAGVLAPADRLQATNAAAPRSPRRLGPAEAIAPPAAAVAPARLGAELGRAVQVFLVAVAAVLAVVLAVDFAVAKHQQMQVRVRGARLAQLADLALNDLQGEIRSVSDLGGGRYELAMSLRNADPDRPIYVMAPDMRAYVQVGKVWQEVPLTASGGDDDGAVRKIDGERVYRFAFEARVEGFAQLLPGYMHVRFSDAMLVSPRPDPQGDVFQRRDNYYIYLKPYDADDMAVAKRTKFPGKPPLWIPMPPH